MVEVGFLMNECTPLRSGFKEMNLLNEVVDQGNPESLRRLGDAFNNSECGCLAAKWWCKAAELGDKEALHALTSRACTPNVGAEVLETNFAWHHHWDAAKKGDAEGMRRLGRAYEEGIGITPDKQQAIEYYKRAASSGDMLAQRYLAGIFAAGAGVPRDFNAAATWAQKAAAQGDTAAQRALGCMYATGAGVKQDIDMAASWCRRSALGGDIVAMRALGMMLAKGAGINQDFSQAAYWYRKSADRGDAVAQRLLGRCYALGQGVEQDGKHAVYWCKQAAAQGDPAAQHWLGDAYFRGLGPRINYTEAAYWYRKAMVQGVAAAARKLGKVMLITNPPNRQEALYCYTKAAELGDCEACLHLANSFFAEMNWDMAFKWWKEAETQGCTEAIRCIGYCYQKGYGVEQDLAKAFELYRLAANKPHNDMEAQRRLGQAYERGEGIERSFPKAEEWYEIAADQGDTKAKALLEALRSTIPSRRKGVLKRESTRPRQSASPRPSSMSRVSNVSGEDTEQQIAPRRQGGLLNVDTSKLHLPEDCDTEDRQRSSSPMPRNSSTKSFSVPRPSSASVAGSEHRPSSSNEPFAVAGPELEGSSQRKSCASQQSQQQSGGLVFGAPKVAPQKPPEKKEIEKVYGPSGIERNTLGYIPVSEEMSARTGKGLYFDTMKKRTQEKEAEFESTSAKSKRNEEPQPEVKPKSRQPFSGQTSRRLHSKKKQLIMTDGGWITV
eukprot:gnl/MRDRNA2_/MRDRNA2_115430_c0_seq1.p1 gnl/MRDRNA2_/MRDRNA2_115430_c0~~gnl/MRDRNA2_/MRDRNA2_115430_c0_seq1.p1  ORF type:complete len:724 (-),score=163.84 gnl/MRDRNA2_/MRDRNA2_115430_c0_seq1:99-2270(-)